MLQDIRQSTQGTTAKIIIGLIVIAFAGFGIESILLSGGGGGVAEVNGEQISPQELQQVVNSERRRLVAAMGDDIDPAMLEDERINNQALEALIERKLMTQSAQAMGLSVSERQMGVLIGNMEQFQVDGQFSPDMYRVRLADVGFTPQSFKNTLQNDLVVSQARSGLYGSEFATPGELALNARVVKETRDLRFVTIPVENYADRSAITDEDINAYYLANSDNFLSEESVELDYIELRVDDFTQPVEEADLRAAYQEELRNGVYQTEHWVSHILFEPRDGESPADIAARVAEVEQKLADGEDFAALAGEYSDDIGSRAIGGELGFTSGDVFPGPMEEAIAALEVGAVSGPVETEAGIHLVKVTDRREGAAPTFDELRQELTARLALTEARVELLRTVESLKDLAFNAEDLGMPASELALEVARSEAVTRTSGAALFDNARLREAAFSEEVLEAGHNSDVIELDRDHWVVLRVHQHNPAALMPLAAVSEQVAGMLSEQRARAAAEQAAQAAVVALRSGEGSVEEVAGELGLEWQVALAAARDNMEVPPEVLQAAFALAAPADGERAVDYTLSLNGDALVFELARVAPGELADTPAAEQQALTRITSVEYGQLVDREYRRGLRQDAEISVL